ncbi:MAG: hypothetical protein LQ340_007351 [Diploschistes diacapsis]|nr:MAG: hypothetical protein LQ340_007351 [Diploschistes diacapsis]
MKTTGKKAEGDARDEQAPAPNNPRTPRRARNHFTNERVVFGPKSKLLNIDLSNFFINPLAWDSLTESQRQHLKERLPAHITYEESGRPSFDFLKYDMNWKSDLRRFQEELADGKYEPEWLKEAQQASEDRAAGKFDAWKLEKFEAYWGQKQEVDNHELSGALNEVQLEHLIADEAFKEGDVWFYVRAFGRGKAVLLLEYNAKLVEIDDNGKLKFFVAGNREPSEKRSHDEAFDTSNKLSASVTPAKLPRRGNHDASADSISFKQDIINGTENPSSDSAPPDVDTVSHQAQSSCGDINGTSSSTVPPTVDTIVLEVRSDQSNANGTSSNLNPLTANTIVLQAQSDHCDDISNIDADSPRRYSTRRNRVATMILDPSTPPKPKVPPCKPQFPLTIKVNSPQELEKNIVLADGRRRWDSRSDSWKRFYCKREGKDIGSLWSFREQYWLRKNGKAPSKP